MPPRKGLIGWRKKINTKRRIFWLNSENKTNFPLIINVEKLGNFWVTTWGTTKGAQLSRTVKTKAQAQKLALAFMRSHPRG